MSFIESSWPHVSIKLDNFEILDYGKEIAYPENEDYFGLKYGEDDLLRYLKFEDGIVLCLGNIT